MASFKREILKNRVHDLLQSHKSAAVYFAQLTPRYAPTGDMLHDGGEPIAVGLREFDGSP
jgi:hypothetical protein